MAFTFKSSAFKPVTLAMAALVIGAAPALAKTCGNDSSGYSAWVAAFSQEAVRNGISQRTIDTAFSGISYSRKTISLDRNQRSFKLSFEQFMQKRGAATIVKQGRATEDVVIHLKRKED